MPYSPKLWGGPVMDPPKWKPDKPYYGSGGAGTDYHRWFKWGPGDKESKGVKDSGHSKRLFWNWQEKMGYDTGGGGGANTDRFAAKYYAGTFDEELNKLAVDTTTLWQGYYPSLYNPHTQEAAEHLPAPVQQQIDPLTGEYITESAPPEPTAELAAPGATVKKDPRGKKGYWRKKRLMKSGDWTPEMQEEYEWDNRFYHQASGAGAGAAPSADTGAPRPTVNPDGTLVPWSWSNWVISMGQWRGT